MIESAVTYSCACRPGLAVGAMNETLGYAPCSNINECDSDDPNVNLCGPNADCVDYTPSYNNETDEQGCLSVKETMLNVLIIKKSRTNANVRMATSKM